MPNTTNYNFPYPAGTDPADVPADMQALADAVDTQLFGHELDDLANVTVPTPSTGDLLAWNGTAWVNDQRTLDELADVSATSPSEGDVLTFDGTNWNKSNPSYACRVRRTTNQSIATGGAGVAITFDSGGEHFDPQGMWDSGTPDRVTIQRDGIYLITGNVDWDANATGYRIASCRLNGTSVFPAGEGQPGSATSFASRQAFSTVVALSAADYVQLWVAQSSDGALNVLTQNQYSPVLCVAMIGTLT